MPDCPPEIWRQKHQGYKEAVAAIAKGDVLGGYDKLDGLGWIMQTPEAGPTPLVDEYMQALKDKASVLVVARRTRKARKLPRRSGSG